MKQYTNLKKLSAIMMLSICLFTQACQKEASPAIIEQTKSVDLQPGQPSKPPDHVSIDLSLTSPTRPVITQEPCKNYFSVKVTFKLTNSHPTSGVRFSLAVSAKYNLTMLGGTVQVLPFPDPVVVQANSTGTVTVTFKMFCPYYLMLVNGQPPKIQYQQVPYTITAAIAEALLDIDPSFPIIDPNPANNKVSITLVSPLPILCNTPAKPPTQ